MDKELLQKIQRAVDDLQTKMQDRLKALESGDVGKAASLAVELHGLQDRLEMLEAKAGNPRNYAAGGRDGVHPAHVAHIKAFGEWLRKAHDPRRQDALNIAAENAWKVEGKAMTIASDPGGGFAVPLQIAADIERQALKMSPVRGLVRTLRASTSDFRHLVGMADVEAGWAGEATTRSETGTPTLRSREPSHGEIYAYPKVSNWALEDLFFDVESWLTQEVARKFAQLEGLAVISGNGTNQPTGILNTTPVLTSDEASPLRSAEAIQYLVTEDGSPSGFSISPDSLIDLVYTVNSEYRANGNWAMNSLTAGNVRKMKDSNGVYLWAGGIQPGQPSMLLGYPVQIIEAMPDIGSNAFPVMFGDFNRGYMLVDISDIRITVDEVTTPGHTKFYVRKRVGGKILNNDALKVLRTVA